jgi:hypothetical protein
MNVIHIKSQAPCVTGRHLLKLSTLSAQSGSLQYVNTCSFGLRPQLTMLNWRWPLVAPEMIGQEQDKSLVLSLFSSFSLFSLSSFGARPLLFASLTFSFPPRGAFFFPRPQASWSRGGGDEVVSADEVLPPWNPNYKMSILCPTRT